MLLRWLVLLLSIFFTTLNAQDSIDNIKLKELIELVKESNLEIKAQDFEQKAKEYEEDAVFGMNFGSLDLVSTYSKTNHAGYVFGSKLSSREATFGDFGFDEFSMTNPNILKVEPEKLNYPTARENIESKLAYQVPLYTGGKLSSYGVIAKKLKELAGLDKEQVMTQKVYEAKKGFYDIALLESFYKNLSKIDENILRLLETVTQMQKEGYAKNIDVLEVEAIRANVLRMKNQTLANKKLALDFLSFLADKEIKGIDSEFISVSTTNGDASELLANNIDIKKAQKGVEIHDGLKRVELANFLPTVGAFAEGGYDDDKFTTSKDKDYYLFGVQAKLNLFSGGSNYAGYEAARAKELKTKTQYEMAKKGLSLKLTQIQTDIKSLEYDVESLKKELELNDKIYENYLGRYQEKLVSINDVIIKQSKQIESTLKLQEVQNKRNERVFEMEKLLNRGEIQ